MGRTTERGHGSAAATSGTRRWPWWLSAAVAGAGAGAAVAVAARRWQGSDPPDAVEPDQVRAVVDRPDGDAGPRS